MLRKRLIVVLGALIGFMIFMAIAVIVLLQDVVRNLDHINNEATALVDTVNGLSRDVSSIEVELYRLQSGDQTHLDLLIDAGDRLRTSTTELRDHYVLQHPEARLIYERFQAHLPVFERYISSLATAQDPALSGEHNREALMVVALMREDIATVAKVAQEHARDEERHVSKQFRWLVLGMGLGFVLLINVSVLLLLRAAGMILRPMDRLVRASRELAHERFEHRVQLDRDDEFNELAQSFNKLAQELQANEQRKLETLAQVSLAMSHELNNAMAIIELQLTMLSNRAGGDPAQKRSLEQIRESLGRMARTIEMLKNARRIVLTEYVGGVKMLDLERSSRREEKPATAPVASTGAGPGHESTPHG